MNSTLSALRKEAGLTQSDLAQILSITQGQVSKYEASGEIPFRLLKRWANAIGCITDDLLPEDDQQVGFFDFDENIYGPLKKDLNRVLHYIGESSYCDEEPYIEQLRDRVSTLTEKPWVVTIGHYDAGKSHFCNFCLEQKRLPTNYQPVTKFPTFVRHISDRPKWFKEDVWIMKPEFEPEKWNDKVHCRKQKYLAGSWDTLENYATIKKEKDKIEKGSVLAFLDVPLLHSCVLVDLPGYDTEMTKTNGTIIDQVIRRADILLFFSSASPFLTTGDLTCFSALLRNLRSFKKIDDNFPTLGNLFIIASQAHHAIKKNQLDDIIEKGSERFYEHFKEGLLRKLSSSYGGQPILLEDIRKRFFSFYAEIPPRREDLQNNLKKLLGEFMPPVWEKLSSRTILKFKKKGKEIYERKGKEYQNILKEKDDYENLETDYENLKKNYDRKKKDTKLEILISMDRTLRKTQTIFLEKTDVQKMTDMITSRYKEKEDAQEQAAAYVLEKILSETDKLQDDFVKEVHKLIENSEQYSEKRENILEKVQRRVSIPYDEEAITGTTVFTGGSVLAVGLGEIIGLSVLTFGIGISAIMGLATALILINARSWQQRLAREIQKILKNEDILLNIQDNIRSCGDALQTGIEEYYTQKLDQIKEVKNIIDSEKDYREKLDRYKDIEKFFSDIPWQEEEENVLRYEKLEERSKKAMENTAELRKVLSSRQK